MTAFPKTKTLLVKAAHPDRPCPKMRTRVQVDRRTGRDTSLIYADLAEQVPNVRYYRQRVRKGDLVVVEAGDVSPTRSSSKKSK